MLDPALLPMADETVRLRPMISADAAAYAEGTLDAEVKRFAHLPEPFYTPASAAAMIANIARPRLGRGDLALLSIADPVTDEFLGSFALFDVTADEAEIGFWVHPKHRGRGVTAAAIEVAAAFARGSGLAWLSARTAVGNSATRHVLAKAGFVETGNLQEVTPSGERDDLVHYVRLIGPAPSWPLKTSRLELRPHLATDLDWLLSVYSQKEVARFLLEEPWTPADATRQLGQRIPRTGLETAEATLALVVTQSGMPVGDVAIWLTDKRRRMAEVGWVFDPAYGGRGYASEAVRAIIELGFRHYRLHRVVAQMDTRNDASARLAERIGMRREGHFQQDWWNKGEWTDTLIYALLATDQLPES